MGELVYFLLPEKHFLDQSFRVNIMVDTGDGNYDYVLNSVYPCWYGSYNQKIDDRAGIVWLAKTQGYAKGQLWNVLRKGDVPAPKGFLESMRVEVANISSHMNTVTFLVEMTLRDLMELNRLIKLQEIRERLGRPVAALLDTKGPEIRIRTFKEGKAELVEGQEFTLTSEDIEGTNEKVSVTYEDLYKDLKPGDSVLIDDGLIGLTVKVLKEKKSTVL